MLRNPFDDKIGKSVPVPERTAGTEALPSEGVTFEMLKKRSPVPIKVTPKAKDYGGGYFTISGPKQHIGISGEDNISALAHEIGHAEFAPTPLGVVTQNRPALMLDAFNFVPSAVMAGRYTPKKSFGGMVGKSALMGLGMSSPVLIHEGAANLGGRRILKDLGATDKQLEDYRNSAIHGQASYLNRSLQGIAMGLLFGLPFALARNA